MTPGKSPLIPLPSGSDNSARLLPNDHVRMLVELLRPLGPELARRWLAALTLVPEHERQDVVQAIEAHIASIYARPRDEIRIVSPPVQKAGYVEHVEVTYARPGASPRARARDKGAG